jgi:hypothetical protein
MPLKMIENLAITESFIAIFDKYLAAKYNIIWVIKEL